MIKKSCVFCNKRRPYNYRKLKWVGVKYWSSPSYWACPTCNRHSDVNEYARLMEDSKKEGKISNNQP